MFRGTAGLISCFTRIVFGTFFPLFGMSEGLSGNGEALRTSLVSVPSLVYALALSAIAHINNRAWPWVHLCRIVEVYSRRLQGKWRKGRSPNIQHHGVPNSAGAVDQTDRHGHHRSRGAYWSRSCYPGDVSEQTSCFAANVCTTLNLFSKQSVAVYHLVLYPWRTCIWRGFAVHLVTYSTYIDSGFNGEVTQFDAELALLKPFLFLI